MVKSEILLEIFFLFRRFRNLVCLLAQWRTPRVLFKMMSLSTNNAKVLEEMHLMKISPIPVPRNSCCVVNCSIHYIQLVTEKLNSLPISRFFTNMSMWLERNILGSITLYLLVFGFTSANENCKPRDEDLISPVVGLTYYHLYQKWKRVLLTTMCFWIS